MRRSLIALVLLLAALAFPVMSDAVAAGNRSGTLGRIAESGLIRIGYQEFSPPFSYATGDGKFLGYSHEYALRIADAIRRELKQPNLPIKYVPITMQNRFAIIQNGVVDFACEATTNTLERQKIIAFSNSIFVASIRMMTRRDSRIKDFSDLSGRAVLVLSATTGEKVVQKLLREKKMRFNVVTAFDRGATPLSILQTGQADAFVYDDVLLADTISQTWRPDDWILTGTPQTLEAYACILQRGDPEFKQVVDSEIVRIMQSGEAETIYRKWLMSPIPPKGVNFLLPMSEAVIELFRKPNDKAFY